jgi:hypothetical protein
MGSLDTVFVVNKKTFNTSFFDCPMVRLMWIAIGVTFDVKNLNILIISLTPGLEVLCISKGSRCCLVRLLFVRLYGSIKMRLSSNDQNLHHFCR